MDGWSIGRVAIRRYIYLHVCVVLLQIRDRSEAVELQSKCGFVSMVAGEFLAAYIGQEEG